MTKFIKKVILLSFASLAIVSFTSQVSYGADAKDIPTNQPTKQSAVQKFFASCLGCLKATEDAVEDIQDVTPVIINDGQDIIDQIDDIINVGGNKNSPVTTVVKDQEKTKKMAAKVKKSDKNKGA